MPLLTTYSLRLTTIMHLNSNQIAAILPQSYPFLMIDRVVDFKKGESLTAVKNITGNEWVFEGQSCQTGVFPETLLIEAAAQAALILYHLSKIKEGEKHPKYILGKTKAEFERSVSAGDQLSIVAFANKMLDTGGYSDIQLSNCDKSVAHIKIVYSVVRA